MGGIEVVPGSFLAINREERFFCSLLTHGLLSSPFLRQCFYDRVHDETGIELSAEVNGTEVYVEVAWLRDHWRNLGDPRKWTPGLGEKRIEFLSRCLACLGRDVADVNTRSFFRTAGRTPKVVAPGRWPLAELQGDKQLELLKWSFNSKPDFLLVCQDRAVIIEAKVESGPGKGPSGFSQDQVQEGLRKLIPAAAPYLDPQKVSRLWLAPRAIASSSAPTVRWADVASMVSGMPVNELDEFSRNGLERFARHLPAHG